MNLDYNEKTFSGLRKFNLLMFVLHLVQGVAMVMVSNETAVKLTTNFLKFDLQNGISSISETFVELPLGVSVAIFLFISSLAHLVISTIYYNKYKKGLKQGVNFARWIEYSLSSSWMIVIIGALVGMFDAPSLLLMFFLNMSMILFGYMMELHNITTKKLDWTSFIFGCVMGIVPWVVMGWYFFSAIYNTNELNPVPDFVYAIFWSLFGFFNVFAINMFLQYKKVGPWKNYLFGEYMYIILSLVAKSLLAWQVWSGTLRG